jgi:signal transduction histidine kinase
MTPPVPPALLRSLFLFEGLPDDQLDWLSARMERRTYPRGAVVFREGDPCEHLFVLLEGGLRRFRHAGAEEVLLTESARPGVFAGAVRPFVGAAGARYDSTLVTTAPATFLRLPAADFAAYVHTYAPMAVHLVGGTYAAVRDNEATIREREYVTRLGALSAGLAHELNNPASAVGRAAGQLGQRLDDAVAALESLAGRPAPTLPLSAVIALPGQAARGAGRARAGRSLDRIQAEEALLDALEDLDVAGADELADVLAATEVEPAWVLATAAALPPAERNAVLRWLGSVLDAGQLVREIQDCAWRISSIVDAVKQYAYLDSAQVQHVDVQAGLESVLVVLAHKLHRVRIVREYADPLPRIPAYPAELNHVWTNLVDNAADALAGSGTLVLRTAVEPDHLRVEVEDDGPGIPAAIAGRIFEPFVTTKGTGAGVGLGLHVAWRIVEQRHHGRIDVAAPHGRTRFTVRLPLRQALA